MRPCPSVGALATAMASHGDEFGEDAALCTWPFQVLLVYAEAGDDFNIADCSRTSGASRSIHIILVL